MSRGQSYRLLDHAHVMKALREVSPVGDIPEGQTRGLKSRLPEIITKIKESVADGADPKDAVIEAIATVRDGDELDDTPQSPNGKKILFLRTLRLL